jgi:tetratricopeptide (TPR) repeat protein
MRRLAATVIFIAGLQAACAAPKKPAAPDPHIPERLTSADALVRAGCYDCLAAAYREYTTLRVYPAATEAATAGAVRSAALLAARERELGTEDSGYLRRAHELVATNDTTYQQTLVPLLEITDTLLTRGAGRQIGDDIELTRMQTANRNRAVWTDRLRAHADEDPLTAYLWLAFNCTYVPAGQLNVTEWLNQLPVWRETALLKFKAATCGTPNVEAIDGLLEADGRFLELNYFLGLSATLRGRIDETVDRLEKAYAWHPRWPAVTTSLGNANITLEEFDQAVTYFDRTLAVVAEHPDALLGKIKALTYAGRYGDALTTIDQLIALERWYVGDARYWRAFNEMQLARNDGAWADVELAGKLLINADVPKLAGLIAYRRKQIDVARAKFQESRERNPADCETGFYLGVVLAEQAVWDRTAEVLVATGQCLESWEHDYTSEIERLRASNDPPRRVERQILRRQQQIAEARRKMATSWFNVAVAYYQLARKDDARQYAERVADDEQFGERARELLSRLR